MPHLFVNRRRKFALCCGMGSPTANESWEWASGWFYLAGGILLTLGSVLFLPKFENLVGARTIIYMVASALYLLVSIHDLFEVGFAVNNQDALLDLLSGFSYGTGAVLFIIGRILCLRHLSQASRAACYIAASLLFLIGAIINANQIWRSPDRISSRFSNMIAMTYMIGSTFYISASVPFLFKLEKTYEPTVQTFTAELYISGSFLFVVGAVINMARSHWVSGLQLPTQGPVEEKEEAAAAEKQRLIGQEGRLSRAYTTL